MSVLTAAGCPGKSKDPEVPAPPEQDSGNDTTEPNNCSTASKSLCLYQSTVDYHCLPPPDTTCSFDSLDLIDSERAGGGRTIPIAFFLPPEPGPLPVVLLSHGGAEGKTNPYKSLPDWVMPIVSAGYAVVAIAHVPRDDAMRDALCEELAIGDSADCAILNYLHYDRPFDIKKVVDWLFDQSNPLYSSIDHERIALLGHSAGAGAAMVIAGASRTLGAVRMVNADTRISAYLAFSPQGPGNDGFDERSWDDVRSPVLFGTGSGDSSGDEPDPVNRREPYQRVNSTAKYLLYINNPDAHHDIYALTLTPSSCGDQDLTRCEEFLSWLESTALAFLDDTLKQSGDARDWLASDNIVTASDGVVEWLRP